MRCAKRLLLLLSTAATLTGLAPSHEALAGCFPLPTPGNNNITCDVLIPPPIIPSLDLSSGGRDSVTVQSGTILGNVTFANDQASLIINNGLIGGSVFFGNAPNDITVNGGQISGNITTGAATDRFTINGGVVGGNVHLGDGSNDVEINGGQVVGTITTGNGNDQFNWTGGSIGGLHAGNGNDNLTVTSGANLSTVIILDGGDDASTKDGDVDNLRFRGVTGTLPILINWEHIRLQDGTRLTAAPGGGSITAEDLTIEKGSSITTDPTGGNATINAPVNNAGTIELTGAGSKITATDTVDNSGTLSATNMGAVQVDGAITNSGTIAASGGGTIAANSTVINTSSGTITASGAGSSISIAGMTDNQGSIAATGAAAVSFGSAVNNSGQITAQGAGSSIIASGPVTNSGVIATTGGGSATITGTITNTGTINTSGGGTTTAGSNVINMSSGTITATGSGSSTAIAGTTNNQGSIAATGAAAVSFSSAVNNSGQITAQGAGSSIIASGPVTNSGVIATTGGGSATITGTITNTGTINTSQGGGPISATGAISSSGTIDVSNNGGTVSTGANLVNTGLIAAGGGSAMIITGNSLNNLGTINLNQGTANSTLTVNGNLTGAGQINLGIAMTQTGGAADKVNVTGDVSGRNNLVVTNLGATTLPGAPTESSRADLVVVQGQAPATAFTLNAPFNYLPIGPFRYELAQGADPSGGTAYRIQAAFDAVDGAKLPALAPSTVGFVAGFTGALSLSESFLSQLYQREGDSALRGEGHANGWVRGIGRWNNLGQSTFGIGYRDSIYGVQGGIGLVRGELAGGDLLRFGITFGFGRSDGSAELRSARSDVKVSGTSVGAFATWFADASRKHGAYADLTVQHSWLNFSLDIPVSPIASYDGTSWGAKIETGYRIPFGQWAIEPQLLLTYLSVHADGFIGRDQLIAESNTVDSLLGRARTRFIGLTKLGNGWLLEPHVEFGVLSQLAGDPAVFVGGLPFATNMPTTVGEVGAGGTLAVSAMTTLFADADVQLGAKYVGVSGRGGVKVRW